MAPNADPSERIRMLEDQIGVSLSTYLRPSSLPILTAAFPAQLKSQLNESRSYNSRSASPSRHAQLVRNGHHFASTSSVNGRSPDGSPTGGGIILPHASLDVLSQLSPDSTDSHPRGSTSSPEMRQGMQQHIPDPLMDVLFSGWDPDLPDPDTLDH